MPLLAADSGQCFALIETHERRPILLYFVGCLFHCYGKVRPKSALLLQLDNRECTCTNNWYFQFIKYSAITTSETKQPIHKCGVIFTH